MGTSNAQSSPAVRRSSPAIKLLICSYRDTQPQGARWQRNVTFRIHRRVAGEAVERQDLSSYIERRRCGDCITRQT
jgi:hypothetical protein